MSVEFEINKKDKLWNGPKYLVLGPILHNNSVQTYYIQSVLLEKKHTK